MRLQNHIGNSSSGDIPLKELTSVYLQNVIDLGAGGDSFASSSRTSSTVSSPTHGSTVHHLPNAPIFSKTALQESSKGSTVYNSHGK